MQEGNPEHHSMLEAQIATIFIKSGVPVNEVPNCLLWAFGAGALYVPIYPEWLNRWRERHPQFRINKSDSFVEWMFVVGHLYCKAKQRAKVGKRM